MGIIDVKFNKNSTHLAVSCLDSCIRHWEIDTHNVQKIECQVMENWKLSYIDNNIVTCGDMGKISFYDNISKERVNKLDAGEIYLTALTVSNGSNFLAAGNDVGNLYIINLEKKNKTVQLRPHYKIVRSIAFTQDNSKILTGSDDHSIKITDLASEKIIGSLEGHKQAVSCVSAHPSDNRILFSSSFDKSIKCWDLRVKTCIGSTMTGSQLWACKATSKHLAAGGDNGILSIYSIE